MRWPTFSKFFTLWKVENVIQRLQHGWSSDYTGLQEEELVHAVSRVTPIRKNLHMRRLIHQSKWLPQKHKRIMILTGDELVEQEELAILSILHTSQSNERNKVLRQELWLIYTQKTWLMPREVLSPKMVYNNDNFMNVSLVHGPYDHQLKEMYCLSCLICVRTARWLVKLQHSVISPHQPSLDTKSNHHYSLTY